MYPQDRTLLSLLVWASRAMQGSPLKFPLAVSKDHPRDIIPQDHSSHRSKPASFTGSSTNRHATYHHSRRASFKRTIPLYYRWSNDGHSITGSKRSRHLQSLRQKQDQSLPQVFRWRLSCICPHIIPHKNRTISYQSGARSAFMPRIAWEISGSQREHTFLVNHLRESMTVNNKAPIKDVQQFLKR